MASQGPLYPGTVTTETGPSGDNDWLNAGNVSADDGSEAQITAATYDANDHSFRLKAQNFGFTVTGTIDGIIVEIEQRRFAGAAEDQEVRLYNAAGTLVGDDKQTATAWPATATIATYGGSTDTWNSGLTAADINDPDFGVAHIVLATAANTDIGVDFIRVTVHYTDNSVVVTPGVASLTTATFAPTVTASDNKLVTPPTAALATSAFAPTVTASNHQTVTPGVAALSLTTFVPSVTVGGAVEVVPGTASLSLTGFAPSVSTPVTVTPAVLALALTAFAPTVTATDPKLVTPSTAALVLTAFAPSVATPRTVTPGVAALSLTGLAPTVSTTVNVLATPGTASLNLTGYAPTVTGDAVVEDIAHRHGVRIGEGHRPPIGAMVVVRAIPNIDTRPVRFGFRHPDDEEEE